MSSYTMFVLNLSYRLAEALLISLMIPIIEVRYRIVGSTKHMYLSSINFRFILQIKKSKNGEFRTLGFLGFGEDLGKNSPNR